MSHKQERTIAALLVALSVITVWRFRRVLAIETAIFETQRMLSDWPGASVALGIGGACLPDARRVEAFVKLSRYEALIERRRYKTLHELQRLHAACAGMPVPPPAAADVDVNVTV